DGAFKCAWNPHTWFFSRYSCDDWILDFRGRKLHLAWIVNRNCIHYPYFGNHDDLCTYLPHRLCYRFFRERYRPNAILFLFSRWDRQHPTLYHFKNHWKRSPDDYGIWRIIRPKPLRYARAYLWPIDPFFHWRIGYGI